MMLMQTIVNEKENVSSPCQGCRTGKPLDISFAYAFQPIVNIKTRSIYAHEALVRGPNGESAFSVLSQVNDANRYQFDQACRVAAVKSAASLGMKELLSINFLPNAVYEPSACLRTTFQACRVHKFPTSQIIFEVTEGERIEDREHLVSIFKSYESFGFKTAIDDFGAGYAGLNLLSAYQPSIIKIDMDLIRNIDSNKPKQAIVTGIVTMCATLGTILIAEGIETKAERDYLAGLGIELMQGYLFCKPAFKALGTITPSAWD
jgi:EAL domain-containing protein (putative c-di-GMP-specific phosphodiesterase class I)